MSNRHVDAAWETETGSPVAKLLLVALADHADASGKCFPSIARLVERTELSRTAVITGLKSLESSGLVTVQRTFGRGSNYIVNQCATRTGTGDAPVRETHPTSAPDVPPPVRETHRTGTGDAPVTLSNPQLNPQVTLTPSPSPRESVLSLEGETMTKTPPVTVDDIYAAYPRKVGKTKAVIEICRAFKKIPAADLLAAVKRYAAAERAAGTEKRFIPHPERWFKKERWNDEDLPQPQPRNGTPASELAQARQDLAKLRSASAREKQAPDYKTRLAQAEARVAQLEGRPA
jgi:hypothetical protein